MKRLKQRENLDEMPKPCDYFHLIGGSGTGGIIALLLGRLKLTAEDALKEYIILLEQIFHQSNRTSRLATKEGGSYKASKMEVAMKDLIARSGQGFSQEELMRQNDDEHLGKTFVCVLPLHNPRFVQRLRTYTVVQNSTPNCKIWEAARATTALPWLFEAIDIPVIAGISEPFIGGEIRCSNPTMEVVHEAIGLFGSECHVQLLLSIGSGHPGVIEFSETKASGTRFSKEILDSLKNMIADSEHMADELARKYNEISDTYFRLNVTHGSGSISLEEWKEASKVSTHTRTHLNDPAISDKVESIVEYLHSEHAKVSNIPLSLLYGQVPARSLPLPTSSRSILFVGQTSTLSALFVGQSYYIQRLKEYFILSPDGQCLRQLFLLHGMGGVGKTQIVLKFITEISQSDLYSYIFWIDGSSEDTMIGSLKIISGALPTEEGKQLDKETTENILLRISYLSTPWLAIFDNADGSPKGLEKYIPQGKYGHILITSRLHSLGRIVSFENSQEVTIMSEESAISLLLKAANIQDPNIEELNTAKQLADILGHLPLAIDMAGAYIQSASSSIRDYLDLYQENRSELLNNEMDEDFHGHTVYGAWDLTFHKIHDQAKEGKKAANAAVCLLKTVAFFYHQSISIEIFEKAAEGFLKTELNDELHEAFPHAIQHLIQCPEYLYLKTSEEKWNKFLFNEGLRLLNSLSIIKINQPQSSFTIHPIIHGYLQDVLAASESRKLQGVARAILVVSDNEEYSHRKILFPHITTNMKVVEKMLNEGQYENDTFNVFADVLEDCGDYIHYTSIQKIRREIINRCQNSLQEDHSATLLSMDNLAVTYRNQGQWSEAEQLQVKVLGRRKARLGEDHPDTLRSMNNLALIYRNQGQWSEAEQLQVKVLERIKSGLGEDHPDTLTSMSNLAVTYSNHGQWSEAEQLQVKVLEKTKARLGEDHPDTLTSMNNLAVVYGNQGQWSEAEQLQVK
ncbi:hypothetical protein M422DRAFT_246386, partial [Sphaerobolus stellatus SS14]